MDLTEKQKEQVEKYTFAPFGCYLCEKDTLRITVLMPQLVEDHEPALRIECSICGEEIGVIPITDPGYEMLLRGELESLEDESEEPNGKIQD